MSKIKIGIQISTLLGKLKEIGIYETFRKLNELGYTYVEMSQVDMTDENLNEIERACKDFGIEITAWGCFLTPKAYNTTIYNLQDDVDKLIALCKKSNSKYVRLGGIDMDGTRESCVEFAQKCNAVIPRLEENGIELYAHNHHREFSKDGGEYLLDIIADNAPKLGLEIDVHWLQRGGVNPIEYIKKYPNRIRLLHLKDYKIATTAEIKADPMYDADKPIGQNDCIRHAVVGEGSLPFPEIIKTALSINTEVFFIEQDSTYGEDAFDCIKRSKEYLESIGYGEFFK